MRKTFMYFVAALLAISCGRSGSQPTASGSTPASGDASTTMQAASAPVDKSQQQTDEYILQRVEKIYADVFAEYNTADENETMPQSSPDEKYCSEDWNKLLLRVIDFDQQHNPDDIGFFEADYWVMGQDFHELSISNLQLTHHDGDEAEVEFDLHNSGSVTRVRLELEYERGNWYIDNFIDVTYGLDWKDDMEDYLKQ